MPLNVVILIKTNLKVLGLGGFHECYPNGCNECG